jgi:hypothetical protein
LNSNNKKGEAVTSPLKFIGAGLVLRGGGSAFTFTRRLFLSKATLPSTSAKSVQSRPVPTFLPAMNLLPRWRTMMLPAVTASPPTFSRPAVC